MRLKPGRVQNRGIRQSDHRNKTKENRLGPNK